MVLEHKTKLQCFLSYIFSHFTVYNTKLCFYVVSEQCHIFYKLSGEVSCSGNLLQQCQQTQCLEIPEIFPSKAKSNGFCH